MTAEVITPSNDTTKQSLPEQQDAKPRPAGSQPSNQKKIHNGKHKNHNNNNNGRRRNNHQNHKPQKPQQQQQQRSKTQEYSKHSDSAVPVSDDKLCANLTSDPRGDDPARRMTKKKAGRNTESFDPVSTLVRPALRVHVGSPSCAKYPRPLKHDDVVIVPELFGPEDDKTLYYKLVEEMTELQHSNVKGSEWISWHEGAHLIVKNPKGSKTFNEIIDKLCDYFQIQKYSTGTRFNWYKDSSDWKPFHHDSAAFNPQRAKTQNITVGVSFGATRELAFLRATENTANQNEDCRLYFPQPNNGVFTFGRDVNIHWKHGINALPEDVEDKTGRVSIILWGLAQNVIEEEGSPSLLGSDGQGPHAAQNNHKYHSNNNKKNHNQHWRRNNNNNNNNNNKSNGTQNNGTADPKKQPNTKNHGNKNGKNHAKAENQNGKKNEPKQ